jgi:imidazolonepropionase-like amidohydrolase
MHRVQRTKARRKLLVKLPKSFSVRKTLFIGVLDLASIFTAAAIRQRQKVSQMRFIVIVTLALALMTVRAAAQQVAQTLILEHANVFMGEHAPAMRDVTVVIAEGRIQSVDHSQSSVASLSAARRIDLRGAWALPGLIDAHVHVTDIAAAHRMLSLGVTTGRSMLTTGYEDVGLKALYVRGAKDIPNILAAGFPVVARPMAMQPDLSSLIFNNLDLDDLRFRDRIGADGARRIVSDNAARHVDWIKVFANGRAGVATADPMARDLDDAELAAAVQQATALGIPVAAHAYTDDGVSAAVRAGVRTVEHGSLVTEPTLRLLHDRGVCFVPTLSAFYESPTEGAAASADAKTLAARLQAMRAGAHGAVAAARKIGVVVIAGTDTGYDAGEPTVIDEIQHIADEGFSPASALDSATVLSASCLGINKSKGAIRPGFDADVVVYATDPQVDLHVLQKPLLVITRGSIYLDNLGNAPK